MLTKITSFLLGFLFLTIHTAAMAQSANPFIGSWDIDLQASDFGSATPPAKMSRTYFDHGDGTYTYMVITTNQDGSLTGTTAHYSYSGAKYPIAAFNQDQQALISYRRESDTTGVHGERR